MNIEKLRDYCLSKRGVSESFPFDQTVLVFKVLHKMFAAVNIDAPEVVVNLKCDPDRAIQLRESHRDIEPGYHMNKKHWNSIYCEREVDDELLQELIDHSYDLVVKGMRRADRDSLMG